MKVKELWIVRYSLPGKSALSFQIIMKAAFTIYNASRKLYDRYGLKSTWPDS